MAIITKDLPLCDTCGECWLPDRILPDHTPNPAFLDPSQCKRCGKCKSMRWNHKQRDANVKKKVPAGSTNANAKRA